MVNKFWLKTNCLGRTRVWILTKINSIYLLTELQIIEQKFQSFVSITVSFGRISITADNANLGIVLVEDLKYNKKWIDNYCHDNWLVFLIGSGL